MISGMSLGMIFGEQGLKLCVKLVNIRHLFRGLASECRSGGWLRWPDKQGSVGVARRQQKECQQKECQQECQQECR